MKTIAADVGGTKTHLLFADLENPGAHINEARYPSNDFDSFEALLQKFLDDTDALDGSERARPDSLTLALPGVISGSEARLTNLPWDVSKHSLMQQFGVQGVDFINDFQASALGTLDLPADDSLCLHHPGTAAAQYSAHRVVVGAGTGLGVAWLQRDEQGVRAFATEGGHIDFAPADAEQAEMLAYLGETYRHVSWERVLSGYGLVNIYEFCSQRKDSGIDGAWIHNAATNGDGEAKRALDMFIRLYGAFVGNLALLYRPENGIYITGGIAAKLRSWMQSELFLNAYLNKGRMQQVVEATAVHLVLNEGVGVLGALAAAAQQQDTRQ